MKKVLGALLCAFAVGGIVVVLRGPAVRTGGPVSAGATFNKSQPVDPGIDESFGYLLKNEGREPAVLEQVRVIGVTGPIEVLGVSAARKTGDRGSFLILPGFPPPEYESKPLADEHVVPVSSSFDADGYPNDGLQLAIGVRATREGFGRIRGIEFTYRVGNRRYRSSSEGFGVLCVPQKRFYDSDPSVPVDKCPDDEVVKSFDKRYVEFRVPSEGASS